VGDGGYLPGNLAELEDVAWTETNSLVNGQAADQLRGIPWGDAISSFPLLKAKGAQVAAAPETFRSPSSDMHGSIGAVASSSRGARRRIYRVNDEETKQGCKRCIFSAIIILAVLLLVSGFVLISLEKSAAVRRAKMVEPFRKAIEV